MFSVSMDTAGNHPAASLVEASSLFVAACLRLSFRKNRLRLGKLLGEKLRFPLVFALGFPYLFIRQDAPRQIPRGKLRFPRVFALGFHYLCLCRKEKNITVQKLNLPEYSFEVKNKEKDPYIFDPARKKYVRLTPEEWVRQNFMRYLCQEKGYPLSRMAVEKRLKSPLGLVRRADIVVYDRHTRPDIIVECKAPSVLVTQETMDQVMRYNGVLGARILCLTNGLRHVYALPYPEGKGFVYLRELPDYRDDAQG